VIFSRPLRDRLGIVTAGDAVEGADTIEINARHELQPVVPD
jgi:hypothetical protein